MVTIIPWVVSASGGGGEFVVAGTVHQALVDHVVDRGSVPCVVRNVRKLGLNKGYIQTRG